MAITQGLMTQDICSYFSAGGNTTKEPEIIRDIKSCFQCCKEIAVLLAAKTPDSNEKILVEKPIYTMMELLIKITGQIIHNMVQFLNTLEDALHDELIRKSHPLQKIIKDNAEDLLKLCDILTERGTVIVAIPYKEIDPDLHEVMLRICDWLIVYYDDIRDGEQLDRLLKRYKQLHHKISTKMDAKFNNTTLSFYYTYKSKLALYNNDIDTARDYIS